MPNVEQIDVNKLTVMEQKHKIISRPVICTSETISFIDEDSFMCKDKFLRNEKECHNDKSPRIVSFTPMSTPHGENAE